VVELHGMVHQVVKRLSTKFLCRHIDAPLEQIVDGRHDSTTSIVRRISGVLYVFPILSESDAVFLVALHVLFRPGIVGCHPVPNDLSDVIIDERLGHVQGLE